MKRIVTVSMMALAFGASVASAQNRTAEKAATAVARSFFDALSDGRWEDAARRLDLKAFDKYVQSQIAWSRKPQREFVITADYLMHRDPKMPRAVAEYQVQQMEETRRLYGSNPFAREFAYVPTADSLAKLSTLIAAARWLQAKDPGWQLRQSPYADSACKKALAAARLPRMRTTLIATAIADSSAYVIFADDYAASDRKAARGTRADPEFLNVLKLNSQGNKWVIAPSELLFRGSYSMGCAEVDSDSATAQKKNSK